MIEKLSFFSGSFFFSVLTYGACLYSFGKEDFSCVLCHRKIEDYINDKYYMGAIVGPYAGRIKGARFTLGGKEYFLDKNENGNTLHSGSACYARKIWDVKKRGRNFVTLFLLTKDGDGGFPGNHEVNVTYTLEESGKLTIFYEITSDRKCPLSVTNHSYFNLGGDTILNDVLKIEAEEYLERDEENIPGRILSLSLTDYDFKSGHKIGERRAGSYDDTFLSSSLSLESERARLTVKTDQSAIHLYTGEFLSGEHRPYGGVCFETGGFPNAPNRPDFPKVFLERGVIYKSKSEYILEVK